MIKQKKKQIILLVFLVLLLVIINYSFIDKALENFFLDYETAHVERVIDGDTVVIENKTSVRLLGINCPERGEVYYEEAKEFLEELVLNKTVKLKFGKEKYDKYDRVLAYIFLNGENINLKLVEKGFANFYFPSGKDIYYKKFKKAWEDCIKRNTNLCEKSEDKCADCIDIKNSKTIINTCSFECDISDWRIKGEGRKTFVFSDDAILDIMEEVSFELELTETGDTLFLKDDEGRLVLWESVGY